MKRLGSACCRLCAIRSDLLILSAGFDAAREDVGNAGVNRRGQRVAGINLSPEDYEEMTARLCGVANASRGEGRERAGGGYGTLAGNPSEGRWGSRERDSRDASSRTCERSRDSPRRRAKDDDIGALAGLTATPSEG